MQTNELTWTQDHRQIIHDLIIQKHATGLSPPEEELLEKMEAEELLDVRGKVNAPEIYKYGQMAIATSREIRRFVYELYNNKR